MRNKSFSRYFNGIEIKTILSVLYLTSNYHDPLNKYSYSIFLHERESLNLKYYSLNKSASLMLIFASVFYPKDTVMHS